MDENSWVGTENVAPMVVKNSKTAGIGARNNVDSTEEYMSCQVHMGSNQYHLLTYFFEGNSSVEYKQSVFIYQVL